MESQIASAAKKCRMIVLASKYRRQVIYVKIKSDIGKLLRELCARRGTEDTVMIRQDGMKKRLENR